MQAYEPKDFVAITNRAKKNAKKDLAIRLRNMERNKEFAPTLRRLSFFYDCMLYALGNSVHFDTQVESIKDVEPALRLIEDEAGVEFEHTTDTAFQNYASRAFTTKCGRITVNASVRGGSENCRSVLVGEKLVPEYKIVCD